MLPAWATAPFEEYRACRIAASLLPYLGPGETLLDCGCGSMRITQRLHAGANVKAFGTDVINLNRTDLSLCLCPGERLPFASDSVDTTCLLFVLHHVRSPIDTLQECLRVSRRRIIVTEDVFANSLELGLLKALDWLGNRSVSADMSLPFNFKSEQEWAAIFDHIGADVAQAISLRPVPWRPSRHRLFILEKPGRNR